jgi:hypothetical protein
VAAVRKSSPARLNPLRYFAEPLAAGFLLAGVGFVLASPLLGSVGGLLLIVLSARVAYDHRNAGRHALTLLAPVWRVVYAPAAWRRQLTGATLFYLAVLLIVGSLRHVAVG